MLSIADADEPDINLTFAGTVYQTVEAVPRGAFFVVTERGQPQEQSIELVSHESDPLEIKSVVHPHDRFATRLETLEAGKRYRLTLRLEGTGAGGRQTDPDHREHLQPVHTGRSGLPQIRSCVSASTHFPILWTLGAFHSTPLTPTLPCSRSSPRP